MHLRDRAHVGVVYQDWRQRQRYGHSAGGLQLDCVSNDSWITITSGASGSGNGAVAYSVGPYGGPSKKRNGTHDDRRKTFSIQQTK